MACDLEDLEDIFEELENVHYPAGPLKQRLLRYKALKYMKEKELEAIYQLVESHAPGLRSKAILRYEKVMFMGNDTSALSLGKDYIFSSCKNTEMKRNLDHMLSGLQEMPKEWTLVQITPQFSVEEHLETDPNRYYTNPLHISLFNCGKKQPSPLCLTIGAPKDPVNGHVVNLVDEMHAIIRDNKGLLGVSKSKSFFNNYSERESYYSERQSIDERLKRVVKDIQDMWLREWRCLFIGKYIIANTEVKIRNELRSFFQKEAPNIHVSSKIENLLFYIVKGTCYLKPVEIKRAIQYCFPGLEYKSLHMSLLSFIRNLSDKLFLIGEKKHPVILIVDDALDCFPWEMLDVLTDESVSRVPSFHFAYALFKEHENEIEDGFKIITDYKKGTYIINPDLDLKNMQTRILSFFSYWLPNWKGLVGVKPTESEFEEMLTSGNIFSYNGHGAGTHFLSMDKIQKIHIKAVVLLFGCGSMKLCEIGPQVERYGAYQMYLIACSPCIVGMLWEVTDLDTDLLTTEFMSQWLPSDVDVHWKHVDKTAWKKGEGVEILEHEIPVDNPNGKVYNEPDLLKALSMSKKSVLFYITKAACVARGIPIKIKS